MRPVWVAVEAVTPERTRSRVEELVRTARQILSLSGGTDACRKIHIVLAGQDPTDLAEIIAAASGLDVLALALPGTASWDLLAKGVTDLAEKECPAMVLFAHTTMAREVGPAVAVSLGGVCVSNVSAVRRQAPCLVFTRPVMDNTRVQDVMVPEDALCILTLAPGASVTGLGEPEQFRKAAGPPAPGRVTHIRVTSPASPALKRISLSERKGSGDAGLGQASIVVAAGRGIEERENLDRVRAFTACFPKAAMAASRPLVDQGWVGYDRQVGITGAVVSPDLYIALGISGSSQHLAGMAGSKWVVSVNKNPVAPICRYSDLCIQADVMEFMDAVMDKE